MYAYAYAYAGGGCVQLVVLVSVSHQYESPSAVVTFCHAHDAAATWIGYTVNCIQ